MSENHSFRELCICQHMRKQRTWITSAEIAEATGIPPRTTRHILKDLYRRGVVSKRRPAKALLYRLTTSGRDRSSKVIKKLSS